MEMIAANFSIGLLLLIVAFILIGVGQWTDKAQLTWVGIIIILLIVIINRVPIGYSSYDY